MANTANTVDATSTASTANTAITTNAANIPNADNTVKSCLKKLLSIHMFLMDQMGWPYALGLSLVNRPGAHISIILNNCISRSEIW